MKDEEIEKQAEDYATEQMKSYLTLDDYSYGVLKLKITESFQDGAKWTQEHAIEWHDLRKDPNDLPKKCNRYWGYVNYYGFQHREILWENNQFDVTGVIAWCELPQFKE